MPSSLIIVALAAAWLVVLVPMVARKRQAVAQTADAALAARVVRSGSGADEGEEEVVMSESATEVAEPEEIVEEEPVRSYEPSPSSNERRYRPGRGGFDPEAAEIAARAKYAFRQRIVLLLIILAVVTAAGAGFLASSLWWLHGAVDLAFVSYLAYLRRQVRIEDEIRQRRLARLGSTRTRRAAPRREMVEDYAEDEYVDDYEVEAEPEMPRRELVGIERRPSPASRMRGRAVVVDLEDEDPEFHELDDPGQLPFRRAVGE